MAHGDFVRACAQIEHVMESIKMQNQNEPLRVLISRNQRNFTNSGVMQKRVDWRLLILVASISILVVFMGSLVLFTQSTIARS